LNNSIENALRKTLENIRAEHDRQNGKAEAKQERQNEPPQAEPKTKRTRTDEKEESTFKLLLELEAQQPQRTYLPEDFTVITKRSPITESRYLKRLWEQGKLTRVWRHRQYYYTLATDNGRTVGQTAVSNAQNDNKQDINSRTATETKNNDDANI